MGDIMLAGCKVLITGEADQVGRAVTRRLAETCDMWGISRYTRPGSREEAASLGVTPLAIDLTSDSLEQLPTDFDYILHFAEASGTPGVAEGLDGNCHAVARVMKHCRNAKAFLHLSSAWVYKPAVDPRQAFPETADIGRNFGGQYAASKITGEGAARAGSLILGMPTVICRANLVYGPTGGGALDSAIDHFVATGEVWATAETPAYFSPLHEDDVAGLVEPSLALATVPAAVVNWCGDETVAWSEIFRHLGRLIDRDPIERGLAESVQPSCAQDPALRLSLAGPAGTSWKDGVAGALKARHSRIACRDVV
jgi:nucleoside-diphosphate-sugar epimerase